ncbi:MAG TPA: bifunctional demethylmenaquinone methyltransferase/2-methoxy-6-polyprenyl-1,4-benzoquinol methylase UbiE [Tepidisphaeraceae bacterium]|nr:bifunctional demethylmenaquinone methyltransferase/2-methoxy-6-polyprenyl-1,4-benzoquinol methylase UbiE [Tepidisphaeraceae bacterium]
MPATDPTSNVWNDSLLQNPHEVSDKRSRIQKMFAAIAPSYDLNNRLHSLWMDQRWRKKAVKLAEVKPTDTIVDVACGTGDLTVAFARALEEKGKVIGIDFTFEMLPFAESKSQIANRKSQIGYLNADALALPLPDQVADILSIAFGIRNVSDPSAALKEFHRVLKPGGRLIILEFSLPTNRFLRALYNFYFQKILPRTATWISRDKTGAYKYLPQSVNTFISPTTMQQMMQQTGFTEVHAHPLTFGICICYRGLKT